MIVVANGKTMGDIWLKPHQLIAYFLNIYEKLKNGTPQEFSDLGVRWDKKEEDIIKTSPGRCLFGLRP